MDINKHIDALKHNKDQAAFEAIYHQTKHAVYAMILPIVRNRFLAEDIMQETYIKMIENIWRYNRKYKFINWLLTIAKNHALDEMKKTREIPKDMDNHENWFVDQSSDIEKRLEVEYYLSLLNEQEKQIVLLKTVGGLTHKVIAKLLNKPIGTITWSYNHAISKIQKTIKEETDEHQ